MKRISQFIILFLLSFSVWAAETGLYIKGGERFEIEQTEQVLEKLISNKNEKLLIFVHGRGKHPEKGIKIIDEMESRYQVKVLMFHWDSWINMWTRPVSSAENAGVELYDFLNRVNNYKKDNRVKMSEVTMNMLIHSMGTIVYESMLSSYKSTHFEKDLFKNVILNGGDALVKNHNHWLDYSDYQENLYVTYNKHDIILKLSTKIDRGKRIGQGIEKWNGSFSPWSKRATYIDLSKVVGFNHKTYLLKDKDKYNHVLNFYDNLIEGNEVLLIESNHIFPKELPTEFKFTTPKIYEFRK